MRFLSSNKSCSILFHDRLVPHLHGRARLSLYHAGMRQDTPSANRSEPQVSHEMSQRLASNSSKEQLPHLSAGLARGRSVPKTKMRTVHAWIEGAVSPLRVLFCVYGLCPCVFRLPLRRYMEFLNRYFRCHNIL